MAHIEYRSGTVSVPAGCAPTDAVGDLIFVAGSAVAGVMQVSRIDIANVAKMPAVGIIVAKSTPTTCRVVLSGIVRASSLTPGARYFAGTGGQPTPVRPNPGLSGFFIQPIGVALDESRLTFEPSTFLTKVIP